MLIWLFLIDFKPKILSLFMHGPSKFWKNVWKLRVHIFWIFWQLYIFLPGKIHFIYFLIWFSERESSPARWFSCLAWKSLFNILLLSFCRCNNSFSSPGADSDMCIKNHTCFNRKWNQDYPFYTRGISILYPDRLSFFTF